MAKYRKKPVVIEAVQWDGTGPSAEAIWELAMAAGEAGGHCAVTACTGGDDSIDASLDIHTLEGDMHADISDWIIWGVQNELYPCKPDIFEMTYEPAREATERTG